MISTKGRYALRVMLDLAGQDMGAIVPLEEIASRQGLSKKYLESILKLLVKGGLIKGLRGKGGGYRLMRAPADYSVGEILELTEGSLAIVACVKPGAVDCERRDFCPTFPMWEKFDAMVHNFFFSITLADLVRKGERKQRDCAMESMGETI